MLAVGLVCAILVLRFTAGDDTLPIAKTRLGDISGSWAVSRSGKKYSAFNTIPYAKPPLGQLRFQATELVDTKWNAIYNASRELPICIQYHQKVFFPEKSGIIGQEDCLYLSVFSHSLAPAKAPVLVYFHGGSFTTGSGSAHGPEYLMDEDIVIVRVQYRLNVFGFLSLEGDLVPGNQGMKDQVLGLRWVQENIEAFGGDPTRVTIMGESAGGASVYHHTVSPLSKDLFHQAIDESGTSYVWWALAAPGSARSQALGIFEKINCSTNPKEGLSCALNKTAEEIIEGWQLQSTLLNLPPVLEKEGTDAFLVGPVKEWKHKPVPLLMGMTSAEGLIATLPLISNPDNFTKFCDNIDSSSTVMMGLDKTSSTPAEVTKKLLQFYKLDHNITIADWVNITNMFSDSWFTVPILDGANNHSGDVYFYYFDYILKDLIPGIDNKLIFGAFHTTESMILWKSSYEIKNDQDLNMSKTLVKIIGNFVKNGNPSVEGFSWKWDKWTKDNHTYIKVDKDGFHNEVGLLEDRYKFWKELNYMDNYYNHAVAFNISSLLIALVAVNSFFSGIIYN